jgi:hypothetical protein
MTLRLRQDKLSTEFTRFWSYYHCILNESSGTLLHDVLRLLLPAQDTNRKYSLRETKLGPLLVQILSLDGTPGGKRILNWKNGASPKNPHLGWGTKGQGNLGTIVEDVLRHRVSLFYRTSLLLICLY